MWLLGVTCQCLGGIVRNEERERWLGALKDGTKHSVTRAFGQIIAAH